MGQAGIEVNGAVRDKANNAKISGVSVEVFQGGQSYDAVQTLGNGKYALSLDHGLDYEMVFTSGGLSVRKVEIKASTIPDEFQGEPFYLTVEMSLFEVPDGFDVAILEEPIGIVRFDARKEELGWDEAYTSRMQKRIQDELERVENSGGDDSDEGASVNKEYEEHMRKAEVEFGRGRWEQSINWLERALQEVPGDNRAETMVEEAQANLERANEEAAVSAEYDRFMREGKIKMKRKDWSGARTAFEGALDLKPGESEPAELLAEINAETAEEESEEEAEEVVADPEPEEDTAAQEEADAAREEAARRKQYDRLIERADRNFDKQNYAESKEQYEEASLLYPNEVYPFDRIAEANERIVVLSRPEEEEEVTESDSEALALDREYEDQVRQGDLAFEQEDWASAKVAYEAAQALKPDERYPKNRLRRLEGLMEEDGLEMESELTVNSEELMQADAEEAQRIAEEADLLAADQARLMDLEREELEAEEALQRERAKASSDASKDRSRNYILARQNEAEDDAEAYYRNALESEIRARGQAVNDKFDQNETSHTLWAGNQAGRRGSEWIDIQDLVVTQEQSRQTAASRREGRIEELNFSVQVQEEKNKDRQAMSNALRKDRMVQVEEKVQDHEDLLFDRTKRYAVFTDSLERLLKAYEEFNRDIRLSSADARIMRYEQVQRKAKRQGTIGLGEEQRRLQSWMAIKKVEREDSQARAAGQGAAELRAVVSLREANNRYSGAPLASTDYNDVQAKEGIREGVEERSFEDGNSLVIERTVRVDNEVNIYRKTVAKHGVYYFKNDRSITKDIWLLETFQTSD